MPSSAFTFHAEKLQTDYLLFTAEPEEAGPHPVALVLDGDDQFEAAADALADLRRAGTIPPVLLVGVGYGGSYRAPKNRRARDYTPTPSTDEATETGCAPAFLEFLTGELLPELGRRYAIKSDDVALAGHSLGSLFGLYALSRTDAPFRRYLVSSPSIWWDNRSVLRLLAAGASRDRPAARAFFSVGNADTDSMRDDLELLERQLAAQPVLKLEYQFERFDGKDHYNALPVAFRAGLRWLYAGRGRNL
ncbi:MAG TPA: alpha/beta hydrolase-fold protein [Opitutaceae bacterium]|nr:alpha/beta hydrolase-fold protein [Opitutaceae bacterium]